MTTTSIQSIFEMRKNGQIEQAYEAVLPLYREHHGHYTTLCMFWTASDVLRLRIEAGRCREAEQILASLRNLYYHMEDKEQSGARNMNRLALLLATKEQEIRKLQQYDRIRNTVSGAADGAKLKWEMEPEKLQFSLLDYMVDFGAHFLSEDDWAVSEWNGHPVPSTGAKIISRIFHEVSELEVEDKERLEAALEFVQTGLQHTPHNKHLLRYQANLIYRLGDKETAVAQYRQLISHSRDSFLFSELAGMIEDEREQAALLSKAIMNQRTEVFAQKDRLTLAGLLKELFPQNAAYELQQVVQLRDSLGQRLSKAILALQGELADVVPVSVADQQEFYRRMMKGSAYAA